MDAAGGATVDAAGGATVDVRTAAAGGAAAARAPAAAVAPPARLSPAIARAARLVRTDISVSLDDEEEPRDPRHLFDFSTSYTYAKERVFKAVRRAWICSGAGQKGQAAPMTALCPACGGLRPHGASQGVPAGNQDDGVGDHQVVPSDHSLRSRAGFASLKRR